MLQFKSHIAALHSQSKSHLPCYIITVCKVRKDYIYILCLLLPWMVRFLLAQIPNLHLSLDKCELPSLWTSPWQIAAQDPGPRIQHFRIPEPHHGPWRNKNSLPRLEIGMPANI